MKNSKYIPLGIEPIFAYMFAREIEVKNLRLILTGKVNNVDKKIINERLRDCYV